MYASFFKQGNSEEINKVVYIDPYDNATEHHMTSLTTENYHSIMSVVLSCKAKISS